MRPYVSLGGWGWWMTCRQSREGAVPPSEGLDGDFTPGCHPHPGTACPRGWDKDGPCWPRCLQKGQLCLGAADLLAMTVSSQCPVGRGRDLAMDLDTFSLCVEGREALRGQGLPLRKARSSCPRVTCPSPT